MGFLTERALLSTPPVKGKEGLSSEWTLSPGGPRRTKGRKAVQGAKQSRGYGVAALIPSAFAVRHRGSGLSLGRGGEGAEGRASAQEALPSPVSWPRSHLLGNR